MSMLTGSAGLRSTDASSGRVFCVGRRGERNSTKTLVFKSINLATLTTPRPGSRQGCNLQAIHKMSYSKGLLSITALMEVAIWAPAPATERASSVHLSTDSKGRLAYASNKSIYIRDIANPAQSLQYNDHKGITTVAKFSPTGSYVASGGSPP